MRPPTPAGPGFPFERVVVFNLTILDGEECQATGNVRLIYVELSWH